MSHGASAVSFARALAAGAADAASGAADEGARVAAEVLGGAADDDACAEPGGGAFASLVGALDRGERFGSQALASTSARLPSAVAVRMMRYCHGERLAGNARWKAAAKRAISPPMRLSVGLVVGVVCGFGAAGVGCASKCPPPAAAPDTSTNVSSAAGESPAAGAERLVVRIDAAGALTIDEQPVALEELGGAVMRAYPDPRAVSTTIQADARVSHAAVLAVLEALRRVGITGVMFSVVGEAPAAAPPPAAASTAPVPQGAASVTPAAQAPAPEQPASLPEVKVENIGLHIGGGPNDDATKEPFRRAIAEQYDAFRRCYTLVDEPAKGGTFGVDLRVGRAGGKADVLQPRTGMRGKGFSECMVAAFAQVDFEKPAKPVMFSYSLRFTIGR